MSVQQIGSPSAIRLRFGPFELNVAERSLRKANQVIPLGGRAYDILIALLENAGEVVGKAELIARVARLLADHDRGNASAGTSDLPPALGRMVGRSDVVLEIQGLLQAGQRL